MSDPLPPDAAKKHTDSLHPAWDYIVQRRDAVKSNPVLFGLVFLIGGGIVFGLFSAFILPGKEATIQTLTTDRDFYKNKSERLQSDLDKRGGATAIVTNLFLNP